MEVGMSYVPKVLIVDDEPRICSSLKIFLASEGYETQTCSCGREAMECLARESFDLILLDLVMPDMTGHQIMDYINSRHPGTLVVVMTGYASLDSAVESLRRGAFDYLRKPFDSEQLLKRVRNSLEKIRLEKEHELMNERLALTEKRYQYLVNASPDIVYTLNHEGEFTFVNGAMKSLLGYERNQLIGKHYTYVLYEDDVKKARNHFNERRAGERATKGVELRLNCFQDDDGLRNGYLTVEIKAMGIYEGDVRQPDKEFIGTYGVARDVTERKRLETQLLHAQKMEAIGTLAGGIAHDFNNLLMGIGGRTSLMCLDVNSGHPHYGHLKSIEDMVKRGAGLTKQLLGFARGGKYEIRPANVNDLIEKCSEMFGRAKKEIWINKQYEKEIWTVEVDRTQIEQVLLNLYVNAWQAIQGNGGLYVQPKNVMLDKEDVTPFGTRSGRYVKISVTDTGVGMDEETQRRIFEPFFTTKKLGRGTGLGLASAYGIIKNHGGIINVHSMKGKGTTFSIYLPATGKPFTELSVEEEKKEEEIQKGHETVVLVDDEDMIVDVGREMLTAMGYKVLSAKGGKEAVERYNENRDEIDMVILDMIMPDMGGGAVFDTLKEINPDAKVLLSSGYSINGQATEIIERGCDGFVQKPFDMGELSQRIRKILDAQP
jgi:PAS domain S-box-containing protein